MKALTNITGDKTLIIDIYVNCTHIGSESAQRIKGGNRPNDINTYLLGSNKKEIKHRYGDGAAALAERVIEYIRRYNGILAHK